MDLFRILSVTFLIAFSAAGDDDIPSEYKCDDLHKYDASKVGTISSPFYGKRNYHNDLNCKYRITAPDGYRIKITFKEFNIAPSVLCNQDYLQVYTAYDEYMLCGTELPNPILSARDENQIDILFRTDYMVNGKGFLLQYESSPYFTSVCDAGQIECRNRNCYANNQRCDGVDNCGDGTDEENCGRPIENFPEECSIQEIKPNTIFTHASPDRIVGGGEAVPNSWPWQVSLQLPGYEPNSHFCGGTLINAQWVLTASHCVVNNRYPGELKIHLGAHSKFKKTQYEQVRTNKLIISYPDLQGDDIARFSMTDDITLIKLNAPVTFNKGVQPACLPSSGWRAEPGWHCYITGWGETRGSGFSDSLKQSEQVVQSIAECNYIQDKQICMEQHKQSACYGDSGGPLNCMIGNRWYVFGAASTVTTSNDFMGPCFGPGAKTKYSNVADKADWIKKIVNKFS